MTKVTGSTRIPGAHLRRVPAIGALAAAALASVALTGPAAAA